LRAATALDARQHPATLCAEPRHLGCNEGWRPGALLEGASSWGIMEVYCAGLVADIQQGC
jgi:hypothetical protein